jgi:hypothetical protein
MLTSESTVRPHPSVVFTRLDTAEAVLLHLETKRYYSLNETGARLWELLQAGASPTGMAEVSQDEYIVTGAQALAAVRAFLDELHQEGLMQVQ